MERTRPNVIGLVSWLVVLFFACTVGSSVLIVPARTAQAFGSIMVAFEGASVGVIWATGVALPAALVVGLLIAAVTGFQFVRAMRIKVDLRQAEADRARAEALQAERDARIWFSELPPGHQLYKHELQPGSYSTPLHLAPGRSNGALAAYSLDDWRAWQFNQVASSGALGQSGHPLIEGPGEPPPNVWPQRVNLLELLPDGQGNLDQIVLGVTLRDGTAQPVTAPLEKMVHVAVGGASGWGKSEFLRAFAFQIVSASQTAEIALIDLEAATFSPFARSERLRYPIADTETDALAILGDLTGEIERRKALYGRHPTVDKLSAYNAAAGEPLPVIALLIDEATVLLSDHRDIERLFKSQVLRARKYGIYAVVGGQSWKHSDFDTAIRGQFSTTVHFQAKDKSSSRVLLGDPAAAELDQIGRAYAVIPGQKMIEVQAPAMSLLAASRALPAGAVPPPMPPARLTEIEQRVAALHADGLSDSAIAREVFNHDGGNQLAAVREIISKAVNRSEPAYGP